MKVSKSSSTKELQIVGRYEGLRKILLSESCNDRLEKPLAHWALPTDRRLPLAFLGRTLDDLLNTSFDELSATPGIGQKKIQSFVTLLSRAADTDPSELPADFVPKPQDGNSVLPEGPTNGFDASVVSEVVWSQWQASVVKHGLQHGTLGRFAPSLKNVTRVIWDRPLGDYTKLTLGEIRGMKTHGEKRVRAILEVFYCMHNLVSGMGTQDRMVVRILPRLIDSVETWIGQALQTPGVPGEDECFEKFTKPLLEQVNIDASPQIVRLAEERLGLRGPISSIRQLARTTGLTRARVYQLLNEVNDIMIVRWPLGRHQVYELRAKCEAEKARMADPPNLKPLDAAIELFYPCSRRGAAGPLEQVGEAVGQDDGPAAR